MESLSDAIDGSTFDGFTINPSLPIEKDYAWAADYNSMHYLKIDPQHLELYDYIHENKKDASAKSCSLKVVSPDQHSYASSDSSSSAQSIIDQPVNVANLPREKITPYTKEATKRVSFILNCNSHEKPDFFSTAFKGIVLCARHKHNKKIKGLFDWNKYEIELINNGILEFTPVGHKKNILGISKEIKPFRLSLNTQHYGADRPNEYHLSLVSGEDYCWKLANEIEAIYFLSSNTTEAQHCYFLLHRTMLRHCTPLLPDYIVLKIPQFNVLFKIPVLFMFKNGVNIRLKAVLDAALKYLNKNDVVIENLTDRNTGLCWEDDRELEWILNPTIPDVDEYLISPRSLEGTHSLHLRLWEEEVVQYCNHRLEGKLCDRYNGVCRYVIRSIDRLLLVYERKTLPRFIPPFLTYLSNVKPSDSSDSSEEDEEEDTIQSAVAVLDIAKIEHELTQEKLKFNGQKYCIYHPEAEQYEWSCQVRDLKYYYRSNKSAILKYDTLLTKFMDSIDIAFTETLCFLTREGDFCIFNKKNAKKMYGFSVLEDDFYIYMNDECCKYMKLSRKNARTFLIVIIVNGKRYVFSADNVGIKNSWVKTIHTLRKAASLKKK
ncbi:hypothetical protein BDB01DRAFT_895016 [Pilobolus umbonatus]|nr:hypothetical protein BDB01DRAFT_895016 [Pilobolus umbonatus]